LILSVIATQVHSDQRRFGSSRRVVLAPEVIVDEHSLPVLSRQFVAPSPDCVDRRCAELRVRDGVEVQRRDLAVLVDHDSELDLNTVSAGLHGNGFSALHLVWRLDGATRVSMSRR